MAHQVAVIGLGQMGSALARVLIDSFEVIVWNRTTAKATPLREAGATVAATPADAIAAADATVVCVGNYADANEVLAGCGDLTGKTLIQLTTGSGAEAVAMERWAGEHGALYLDGVIVAYPSDIGARETLIPVAGADAAWQRGKPVILALGGASQYLGADVTAPPVLEAALNLPPLMATMGMIQGAYMLEKSGLSVGPYVDQLAALGPRIVGDLTRQGAAIAAEDFGDAEAMLHTWTDAVTHTTAAFAQRDFDVALTQPIVDLLQAAVAAGYGEEAIAATIKVLRARGA